jgi:hypothetical protein
VDDFLSVKYLELLDVLQRYVTGQYGLGRTPKPGVGVSSPSTPANNLVVQFAETFAFWPETPESTPENSFVLTAPQSRYR